MRMLLIFLLGTTLGAAAQDSAPKNTATSAQETAKTAPAAPQENPFTSFQKVAFDQLKAWLLSSAEKMPDESYSFKPAESVRTYGQLVGHLADAQYMMCSAVRGEQNPRPDVEKSKTSKSDLIAALKEGFGYCDKAYEGMSDTSGAQIIKFHGRDMAKLSVLSSNNMHLAEHYGNVVTYMRMKNIVPPSSERAAGAQQKK